MKRRWLTGTASALTLALATAAAHAQTVITPDVGARGLGTTAAASGNVTLIGGGTLSGTNLFHSFSQFSLGAGDVARWTLSSGDPTTVHNVVNRVTGGQPSNISGEIDSTALPNAAFFFINPAGIVFGAGAQLNVPAAAYFSTASELRFADGSRFALATPGGSTLSIAAPQSFGFVGGEGAVGLNGVTAGFTGPGTALSLSGANISVSGATFTARGLDLSAAGAGPVDVPLANPLSGLLAGNVSVKASQLVVSTDSGGGGTFRVGGGAVTLDGSILVSDTANAARGADLAVNAAGTLTLANTTRLGAEARGAGAGGNVTLTAKAITADNGSAFVLNQAGGVGGQLLLTADTISLSDAFTASSNSTGPAAGGSIAITARSTLSMDGAFAVASALGSGRGGDVTLTAPTMQLNNALATTAGAASGRPGDTRLSGGTITATNGLLGSAPGATNDTGNLDIEAATSFTATGVSMTAATFSAGAAGTITISAPKVVLNGGFIENDSFGSGNVGTVTIQGGDLTLNGAQIEAEARGTTATNQLGLVQLKATGDIHISQGLVSSDAFSTASGGTVSITGANVTLDGAMVETRSAGPGAGGQLNLRASGTLHVGTGSTVSSDASDVGNAGDVTLNGQTLTIDGGAVVSSDTLASGRSGAVTVGAGTLNVSNGAISSSTFGDGPAGNVTVTADHANVDQGGAIVSEALPFSTGRAGVVSVNAGTLKLATDGLISTSTGGAGDAGAVSIKATTLSVDGAEISSAAASGATGASGALNISADSLAVTGGGAITTLSNNPKAAGQVAVTAGNILVAGAGSAISSENQAGNRAFGNRRGQAGDAGSVLLTAGRLTVADGGAISTNSFAGAAGQIGISIETPGVLVLQGANAPGVIQTSSGPGTGGKITIDEPLAVISNGGSILALGKLNGANVDIDAKYFINSTDRVNTLEVAGEIHLQAGLYDVSSGTISRDVTVLDASKVLRGQCPAARAAGSASQLITRPVGPYAREAAPAGSTATTAPGDCR